MIENLPRFGFDEYIGKEYIKFLHNPANSTAHYRGLKLKGKAQFSTGDIENRNPNVPWRIWIMLVERHLNGSYLN